MITDDDVFQRSKLLFLAKSVLHTVCTIRPSNHLKEDDHCFLIRLWCFHDYFFSDFLEFEGKHRLFTSVLGYCNFFITLDYLYSVVNHSCALCRWKRFIRRSSASSQYPPFLPYVPSPSLSCLKKKNLGGQPWFSL